MNKPYKKITPSPNKWMEEVCLQDGYPLVEVDGKMRCNRCQREWPKEVLHLGVVLADEASEL